MSSAEKCRACKKLFDSEGVKCNPLCDANSAARLKRRFLRAYHPDKLFKASPAELDEANVKVKEFNNCWDLLVAQQCVKNLTIPVQVPKNWKQNNSLYDALKDASNVSKSSEPVMVSMILKDNPKSSYLFIVIDGVIKGAIQYQHGIALRSLYSSNGILKLISSARKHAQKFGRSEINNVTLTPELASKRSALLNMFTFLTKK